MSESEDSFRFDGLTKIYRIYESPRDRLVEIVTGRNRHTPVTALRNVSGRVPRGTALGLVGENGAGKSTFLKILSGTTQQTSGSLSVRGRVASILELGAAFHPEVTGRRNVVLQAALAGLTSAEITAALPEIEDFAELGEFFDRPVRTYSSGMSMRLAFAVATAALPDVVILDEALAVGDGHFQKKCVDRIFSLKASGRTIVFCSHAMYYVTTLCDRAIWLRDGAVAAEGEAHDVVLAYERFLAASETGELAVQQADSAAGRIQPGSHGAITSVRLVGSGGDSRRVFRPRERFAAEIEFVVDDPARPVQLHVGVATRDQVNCFAADSRRDGVGPFTGATHYKATVVLESLPLAKGEFVVHVFLGDETALAIFDANMDLSFEVEAPSWSTGLFEVPMTWKLERTAP